MAMNAQTAIRTTKTVYPQIYAYVTPNYPLKEGWIKIGYTEQKDVQLRIRQQTQTAGIATDTLWTEPARFLGTGEWFKDKQFHTYLRRFKQVRQRPQTEWFYYDGSPEQAHEHFEAFRGKEYSQTGGESEYQLRAEQEEAVRQTLDYAQTHAGGEFLWNAKPRFGKTLSAYDLAQRMGATRVLIVTNRPAIANAWYDDFERFIAWQYNYRFVSTTDSLKDRKALSRAEYMDELFEKGDDAPGGIHFLSLQDLKGSVHFGGKFDKLEWVKGIEWDLLIIDEAHEGVDTFKTDVAFNAIARRFTLHLSGTPFKQIAGKKFSAEQIFNWTYADEQAAKAAWPPESEAHNPYEDLPRMNLFSYQMSRMITDAVNQGARIDGEDIDFAFDLNEFFATNDSGEFIHKKDVLKWLDTLTRNEKYPFSTPQLRRELQHTLWLLDRVASAKALHKIFSAHPVFEHYEVILAAGDGKTEDDPEVTEKSYDRVRKAIAAHERTITLSVGQLTTGVTIPEWTAVLMLSNLQSAAQYMQAAFRAQNPWEYEEDGQKHRKDNAYLFDFAPERTLQIYEQFANGLVRKTAAGGGTTGDREQNIRTLLNFFPVIAEDDAGTMTALDVRQVLTIPRTIKAQEVVRRGFMSNLLFQNISGIFGSAEVREILEQLNPVPQGKVTPSPKHTAIDTQGVEVDAQGEAVVPHEIVVSETEAHFGAKVYAAVTDAVADAAGKPMEQLAEMTVRAFTQQAEEAARALAKENGITAKGAEQIVKDNANAIAREVEYVKKEADIREAVAQVEYKREVAEAAQDTAALEAAKARFEETRQQIREDLTQKLTETVEKKVQEHSQAVTEQVLQKAEDKKKNTVEDDIRARLRGFARTIPSFLMAYGGADTALANFDAHISDSVFQEVTGITLEQFCTLRDTYHFFDEIVFNESVQEFLRLRERLADYFDETQTEDIFDYIPPQKTNQIFTPKRVVRLMIDKLEGENPGLFTNPALTFADLYVKSGLYLTEIVRRLYAGLAQAFPDPAERLRHILERQIYGFAPSEIIYNIARNFVYGGFPDIDSAHLQCQDLTETAKNGGTLDMKFDVVVGNPPYQEETKDTSDSAIYNIFYDLAEHTSQRYCLISPARFLFNAGKTPTTWNEKMLQDEHLEVLFYEQNSANVFPNTDIKGGVAVLYRDAKTKFGKIGTFTIFEELNSIVRKVENRADFESIVPIIHLQQKLNLAVLYTDYPNARNKVGSQGTEKRLTTSIFETLDIFSDSKQSDADVSILGLVKNRRKFKFVNRKYLEDHINLFRWKVLVPAANGTGAIGEVLSTPLVGEPLVGEPLVGFTQSFISFGNFETENEAQACIKYIKSKFARAMLGVLKVTQHNTADKWVKVPLQDFTPRSDIDWTQSVADIDRQLYQKYGLDAAEIAFIEEKVRGME
jgi:superfamily II DNA or RNA helicase